MSALKVRALVSVLALVMVGCGGPKDRVEVFPVKGVVNYNGKPMVGGGSISFIPKTTQQGKTAGGIINKDGTYTLGTYGEDDGSMLGDFRVVIAQVVEEEPQNTGDGTAPATGPNIVVEQADRIPAIYSDYTNSPLSAKVEAKPNEIDFSLDAK